MRNFPLISQSSQYVFILVYSFTCRTTLGYKAIHLSIYPIYRAYYKSDCATLEEGNLTQPEEVRGSFRIETSL
jgi:hypothetical protein